jgi:hypothetical protein
MAEVPLESLVRRVVGRALGERDGVRVEVRPATGGSWLVTAADLAGVPDGGALRVAAGARVTPLAREEAFRRSIHLGDGVGLPEDRCPRAGEPLRVAVGADHGGFRLKADVVGWLR